MKTIFVTILLLFLTIIGNAQANDRLDMARPRLELERLKQLGSARGERYLKEDEIAGSAYLDKQFQKSYLLKENGAEIKDMQLRYNLYNNSMEMIQNGQILSISFPSEIRRINMGGKIFVYAKYSNSSRTNRGFFQILYEGDYQLLKKDQVTLKQPDITKPGDSLRFQRLAPMYYIRYRDEGLAYWVSSQKSLIKHLQPISQNVVDHIKTNNINTKNESELIELMKFIEDSAN